MNLEIGGDGTCHEVRFAVHRFVIVVDDDVDAVGDRQRGSYLDRRHPKTTVFPGRHRHAVDHGRLSDPAHQVREDADELGRRRLDQGVRLEAFRRSDVDGAVPVDGDAAAPASLKVRDSQDARIRRVGDVDHAQRSLARTAADHERELAIVHGGQGDAVGPAELFGVELQVDGCDGARCERKRQVDRREPERRRSVIS